MLDLRGRRCLVVGGGGVALRKVDGLVDAGARVTVVATEVTPALALLAERGEVRLERRTYEDGEAAGYALVFAATDDRAVNRRVFEDADGAGVWANVAADPELCSFHLPARVRRGVMQLAVASAGEAPFVVRRLRQLLERRFGPEWAEWMEAAGRFRRAVLDVGLSRAEREDRFDAFFAATVDPLRLTARVPTEREEDALLECGEPVCGERRLAPARREPAADAPGLVSLVGAGPGDAGLLTVRGRRRLLGADAVVYDRLAATALPCDLPASVELHCVGKTAGNHPVPQEEINALLVRLGRAGRRVVRLKGGDPYVYGRGGEEALALAEAGVPFEVVPAVTAGVAVPGYAGIPVTHRRESVRVTLVTAHEAVKSGGPQVRWDLLAGDPHATLIGYMGVTALSGVVEKLLAAGLDPETPAALVEAGTTAAQRVVRAPVAELPAAVLRAGLRPPGLFVIGPTVAHADRLDWFATRPLFGERLLVPAPAGALGEALELAGAEVVEAPLPMTPAARVVVAAVPLTGCLVRCPDDVELLDEERDGPGWGPGVVAWCLGEAAAARARACGWRRVEELDEEADAGAVVATLRRLVSAGGPRPRSSPAE